VACSNSQRPRKERQAKRKIKSMLIIFFDTKGAVHKEFVRADQTVNCYVLRRLLENVRRLRPELWRQMNWLLHHDNTPSTLPFSPENFWPKTTWLQSPPTLLFSVSPIEDKTEMPPLWNNWGYPGRMQAVLNTLTEHDFQDAFKKLSEALGAYTCKWTTSSVMVTSGPKVSFWPDGSTSPGNYGWLFVLQYIARGL
jgi:hypothetical protein